LERRLSIFPDLSGAQPPWFDNAPVARNVCSYWHSIWAKLRRDYPAAVRTGWFQHQTACMLVCLQRSL